jgi:hypothetical protein
MTLANIDLLFDVIVILQQSFKVANLLLVMKSIQLVSYVIAIVLLKEII